MSGEERHPVVTDTFVLVPLPPANSTDTLRVTFRGRDIAN